MLTIYLLHDKILLFSSSIFEDFSIPLKYVEHLKEPFCFRCVFLCCSAWIDTYKILKFCIISIRTLYH